MAIFNLAIKGPALHTCREGWLLPALSGEDREGKPTMTKMIAVEKIKGKMKNSLKDKISENIFSFYIYYANLLLGWQIVSFIYLYQSTVPEEISVRLEKWSVFDLYVIGIGVLITILLLVIHRIFQIIPVQFIPGSRRQMMLQNLFLVLLFFNILAIELNVHLDVLELIAFVFAVWLLLKWGAVFYNTGRAGWMHPTTHGSFSVSALLTGCSLLGIFNLVSIHSSILYDSLLVLLILDLCIVYARFKYLSNSGQETMKIARTLMGSHILFFGARIILGIFMPAIFIVYMMIIKGAEVKGVEILILVGTAIDRFLFVNSVNNSG